MNSAIRKNKTLLNVFWSLKPLQLILILALVIRVIAAIFSRGYVVRDDHFMVVETAQAWVDGTDFLHWLPHGNNAQIATPSGRGFTFVGIHYFIISVFQKLGIFNATTKIFLIRLLHALFSLLIINYSYRISHLLSNKHMARYIGLLIAVFWLFPFASVHGFVEFFITPFLLLAIWYLLRVQHRNNPGKWSFFAGLSLGIAFSSWFFSLVFIIGIYIVLAFQRKWKSLLMIVLGTMATTIILQGFVEMYIWGRPFAEFSKFFSLIDIPFTSPHHTIFSMYVTILVGVIIPPISFLWLAGWIRGFKKYAILVFPSLLVFLFFSFSKQQEERFIISVLPMILISGILGWNDIIQHSVFWSNRPTLYKSFLMFFWGVNFILLIPVSTMYSTRSRVEAMLYLQRNKEKIHSILVEDSNRDMVKSMPQFYLEKFVDIYKLPEYSVTTDTVYSKRPSTWEIEINSPKYFSQLKQKPEYVLFIGKKNLDWRIQNLLGYLPDLKYQRTIKTSFIDRLLYNVNSKYNVNENIYIYKTD